MRRLTFSPIAVGFLLMMTVATAIACDAKNAAIKKERKRYQGTWRIVTLEVNGNRAKHEDVVTLTVVNRADGTWSLRSGGQGISSGISTIDPTNEPKTIDFAPSEGGGKGNQHLGIYEISANSRRLCFAPQGAQRPTEFTSTSDNKHILVTFERVKDE